MSEPTELTKIEAIEKETRAFVCPSCHTHLQFLVRVNVMGVKESLTGAEHAERDGLTMKTSLTPEQELVINQVKRNGVFDQFVAAVTANSNGPRNLESAFFTAFKTAKRLNTPQFAIRLCLPEEDRGGNLELWNSGFVHIIVRNGEVLSFVPVGMVQNGKVGKLELANDRLAVVAEYDLETWVRTRNGYVGGKGLLFRELAGKQAGQFETATSNKIFNGLKIKE